VKLSAGLEAERVDREGARLEHQPQLVAGRRVDAAALHQPGDRSAAA
jgi:hypothetical protein